MTSRIGQSLLRRHIIDPDEYIRCGGDRPWCGHPWWTWTVEHPDDATCRNCLRKYESWVRSEGAP